MNLYGHEVELAQIEDGEMVTDVIVLARIVSFDSDGDASDTISIRSSRQTTGIVQQGMLTTAERIQAAGWAYADDEDEQ